MLWLIPVLVLSYLMVGICVVRVTCRVNHDDIKSMPGFLVGVGVVIWPIVLFINLVLWFFQGIGWMAKGM